MSQIDAHYTSGEVAKSLVDIGAIYCPTPKVVADFAAGRGSLLDAASAQWDDLHLVANDLHRSSYLHLKRQRPEWSVTNANFVDERSLRSSKLSRLSNIVDLALLNPPFSQRGGALHTIKIGDDHIECGIAAAFIARTLDFLTPSGAIISILPDGCLTSERDGNAWKAIERSCEITVEKKLSRQAFDNAFPNTSIVSVRKRNSSSSHSKAVDASFFQDQRAVVRGWQQMHTASEWNDGFHGPLVHTTNLKANTIQLADAPLVGSSWFFQGPALLFPRVGKISKDKVCILRGRRKVVLSDCVIAVQFDTIQQCENAQEHLFSHWSDFVLCYSGTGAPYVTIRRIRELLIALKI
ncbi:hypothetical protein SAMN05216350_108197 [Polaromonas sp. YR568]|uniref:hypothetical protein n=1 Tax=Polaromonas sp. YR568 TaxID=1855301 RepID=UPI0008DF8938|nr:hypothetical protein [Polaromonas sp. YR568]SFU92938.1 hypothetical protein SAMN05216350_108197 [Polaromonas sp. YR568]